MNHSMAVAMLVIGRNHQATLEAFRSLEESGCTSESAVKCEIAEGNSSTGNETGYLNINWLSKIA